MKYIRTKEGKIYEVIEETKNGFELCSPFEKKMGCSCIVVKRMFGNNEKPTYRLADTIEELCDEFVVENPEKDIHERCCDLQDMFDWVTDQEIPIGIKHFDEERNLISGHHDWNVYGAIWTYKGLIYVAKMNEKGELELL